MITDDYRVPSDRESLGQMVRRIWTRWAREQDDPKPSWLTPWDDLSEPDREVDRRIGEALYLAGYVNGLAVPVPARDTDEETHDPFPTERDQTIHQGATDGDGL